MVTNISSIFHRHCKVGLTLFMKSIERIGVEINKIRTKENKKCLEIIQFYPEFHTNFLRSYDAHKRKFCEKCNFSLQYNFLSLFFRTS